MTIPAQKLTMIGVQFADVDGTSAISVQDLFKDPLGQGMTGATAAGNADQLMYWDPNEAGSYVSLYLCRNTATSSAAKLRHNKWLLKSQAVDTTWGTGANLPSPKVIPMGRGVWYKRKDGAGSLTFTLPQPYSL